MLTNGKTWQLFDSHIQGQPSDRLVATANLADTDAITAFLQAIGKESVQSAGIESYARHSLLRRTLDTEFFGGGALLKALRQKVRGYPSLAKVTEAELRQTLSIPSATTFASPTTSRPSQHATGATARLSEIVSRRANVTGTKPVRVTLPDGSVYPTKTWKEVALAVVAWIGRQPSASVPDPATVGYTLHTAPHGRKKPMREPLTVTFAGASLWLETHMSAADMVRRTAQICTTTRTDADSIAITYG